MMIMDNLIFDRNVFGRTSEESSKCELGEISDTARHNAFLT